MSKLFERLLEVRGMEGDFLRPKYEDSVDPNLLPDMEFAVERIRLAKERGEKCLIYGDYDVDGVTASTVMYDTLKLVGIGEVGVMLPNRFTDGYGMSARVVRRAVEDGVGLVLTVDCGSRNHEIVAELAQNGVDTIVTDHHECGWGAGAGVKVDGSIGAGNVMSDDGSGGGETVGRGACSVDGSLAASHGGPAAVAVVNPKRRDIECPRELRELAGVGVAFKLAQALVKAGMIPDGQEKWLLDLVAVGTICDSMMLTGENRRLCQYGFLVLEKTRRAGLKELMVNAGVKSLSSDAVGYQIGPRLNAAGRLESADLALGVLMAKRRAEAASLATRLEDLNLERKSLQSRAVREIEERGVGDDPVIIESGAWHEGVLGIIAGRLTETYRRPAFVLAEVNGELKGSGRSFGEFNLAEALDACRAYIVGGGGHAAACGVRVEREKFEGFRRAINTYYGSLKLTNQERFLDVREDLVVEDFREFSLELMEELQLLEPYGEGNQRPVFLLPEVRVMDVARLGVDGKHLRLLVQDVAGNKLKVMGFNVAEEFAQIGVDAVANVWVTLEENVFGGIRSVEGRLVKMCA